MIKFDVTSDIISDLLIDLFKTEVELLEALSVVQGGEGHGEYFYGVEVRELERKVRSIARKLHELKCFEFSEWKSI